MKMADMAGLKACTMCQFLFFSRGDVFSRGLNGLLGSGARSRDCADYRRSDLSVAPKIKSRQKAAFY